MKNSYRTKYPFIQKLSRAITAAGFIMWLGNQTIVKADGVGFTPIFTPLRAGQLNVLGVNNLSNFTQPFVQLVHVYVNEGETLFYEMSRAGNSSSNTLTYSVYSPAGIEVTEQSLLASSTALTSGAITVTAGKSGIWTLKLQLAGSTSSWRYNADARTNGADPNTRIGGRVYTEQLYLNQGGATNIPLHVGTPSGHKYDILFSDYSGAGSRISSDQYGLTAADNCTQSIYKSADWTDPSIRSYAQPTCGVYNKLFFTPIDATMPASAPRWDLTTNTTVTEWLNPAVTGPVITNLAFNPNSPGQLAGNFTFNVSDFVGSGTLLLDLDNDGIYGGANDRSLPFALSTGNQVSLPFDGNGANDTALPVDTRIKAKVLIDKNGEVHFTMIDVEVLGGVQVTRTTGDSQGIGTLYWDDSQLSESSRTSITPVKDGTSGVNSNVTGGVHGWGGGADPWGENRLIDNWAYVGVASTQEITLEGCAANAGTISR